MMVRFPANVLDALERGDAAAAERACRSRLLGCPEDVQARALLPVALLHQGKQRDAVPLLEQLALDHPDDASHVTNLGLAWIELGRHEDAIRVLAQAAVRWPGDPQIRTALGHARLQRGYAAAAADDLQAALAANSSNSLAAALLARAWQESGERDRGATLALRVLASAPSDPTVLNELALALIEAQHDEDAERCLRAVLSVEQQSAAARLHLAQLYERQNRLTDAATELALADAGQRTDPLLGLMHGRILRRQRRFDDAQVALDRVLREFPSGPVVAEAATELGHVLDAQGLTDAAMQAFTRGNDLMLEVEAGGAAHVPQDPPGREWLLTTHDRRQVAGWSPPVAPADDTPVFVVGFPRSGTTLLEVILDAHPALQAMEERPAIDAVVARLTEGGRLGDALARLTEGGAAECRRVYWHAVQRYLSRQPGRRLVDRYPLNMSRLAVIERVFPRAPIVLLVRHPCDVVLSCFMNNFRIRDGTVGFHRLENGARIYDRVMRKWLAEVEAFDPRLLVMRYEDMVSDYAPTVRRLAGFLELEWSDRLLDPAKHAATKGRIHTPSYSQVVRPIYKDSVQRWRRYERHLAPVLPILEPWIRHWGYEEQVT